MSSLRAALPSVLRAAAAVELPDGPEADLVVAPQTLEEAAAFLEFASDRSLPVLVWGAGTHQGFGYPVEADVVLSTHRLDEIVAWEPEDMTVVVQAGVRVDDLERRLAQRQQSAVLPEWGSPTVGGVVAAGISAWRRARYGPTRDRMLEVTLVTGDGRIVRGGGRVVKNVTGYDLPRLAAGSFGSLGLIGQVCLKLWPTATATATVEVADPERAWRTAYRPLAVLQSTDQTRVYLAGTPAEVEGQVAALDGEAFSGLDWPSPPAGETVVSLRVRPDAVSAAIERLPDGAAFVAAHGVGDIAVAFSAPVASEVIVGLRRWAEQAGGAAVIVEAPTDLRADLDPWGTPPPSLALQRRVVAGFDPVRVMNPGKLPGRI